MATFDILLTFPDPQNDSIIESFVKNQGYQDNVLDKFGNPMPNPESRAQAFHRLVAQFVKNNYVDYQTNLAVNLTKGQTISDLSNIIIS